MRAVPAHTMRMEQRIHVLLIEDDPEAQLLLSLTLNEACGADVQFTMESFPNLKAGLDALSRGVYDILLLDLMLPDSGGVETVIRAKQAARDTPIVVLTSLEEGDLGLEAIACGAQDFLVKGSDARQLRRALSYALQRSLTRRVEQVEAEIAERRRIEAFKDQVLSTVSHELRSPLTITKAAIANLADDIAGPINPDQRQLVRVAGRNLERLTRIINNFLDLSRLESGKAKIQPARFAPGPLMEETLHGLRLADRDGRLRWELALPSPLPDVHADPDLFLQVLQNLLDNAGRFARSRVRLEAAVQNDRLVIGVADDGPGVPPELAPKLFGRFVQLDRHAGGGYKGTGLGLAICREIASACGGSVWLEPGGPGACFRFAVPLAAGRPAETENSHGEAQGLDR